MTKKRCFAFTGCRYQTAFFFCRLCAVFSLVHAVRRVSVRLIVRTQNRRVFVPFLHPLKGTGENIHQSNRFYLFLLQL